MNGTIAKRWLACIAGAIISACGGGSGSAASPAFAATPATPQPASGSQKAPIASRVTALSGLVQQPLGSFNGVAYTRSVGTLSGIIDPRESISGLAQQPVDASGNYDYTAQFEIIAPAAGATANHVAVIEAENRGRSQSLASLDETAAASAPLSSSYEAGMGSAFLENHATTYARVQWQTGIAAGVPANAQGVGLAIVRDFARFLRGSTSTPSGASGIATYPVAILTGISQSAWFVDDFIAEGFNADPVLRKGVFGGAIAIDGTGNWLAINQLAAQAGAAQQPYVLPSGVPLTLSQLLERPTTDPLYVDVATYTDFYRLRASLTDAVPANANAYRYDWPSPHATATIPASSMIFAAGCNGGVPMTLNPIGYHPYYRALLIEVEHRLGASSAAAAPDLPSSAVFAQTASSNALTDLNLLPGVTLTVPATDANAMPVGGVRFPDADLPLGEPQPAAISPVTTASPDATCGNYGGFAPFTAAELIGRYGSDTAYATAYDAALKVQIAAGYVLPEDETRMVTAAQALYDEVAAL